MKNKKYFKRIPYGNLNNPVSFRDKFTEASEQDLEEAKELYCQKKCSHLVVYIKEGHIHCGFCDKYLQGI